MTALLSPLIFVPFLTFTCGRQNYNWELMKHISRGDDSEVVRHSSVAQEPIHEHHDYTNDEAEQKHLAGAAKIARWMTLAMTLCFLILWPFPLYGSGYIFSGQFSTGWIVVGIIWLFFSTACVGVYPLWESRATISYVSRSMLGDLTGKPVVQGRGTSYSGSGAITPQGLDVPTKVAGKDARKPEAA